ncbi:MAG: hypothetical protein AAGB10_02315 [Pseudomonadota bacterium]
MTVHMTDIQTGHRGTIAKQNGTEMIDALRVAAAATTAAAKVALQNLPTVQQVALIENSGAVALQVMMVGRPISGMWATQIPAQIAALPSMQEVFMAWKMSGHAPLEALGTASATDIPQSVANKLHDWITQTYRPSVTGEFALAPTDGAVEVVTVFCDANRQVALAFYLKRTASQGQAVAGCLIQSYDWMEAKIQADTPDLSGLRDLIRAGGSKYSGVSEGQDRRVVYGSTEVVFSASKQTVFHVA